MTEREIFEAASDIEDVVQRDAYLDGSAKLVDLRYFAGLSIPDCQDARDLAVDGADRWWAFARA
jgi:hypothetical protein